MAPVAVKMAEGLGEDLLKVLHENLKSAEGFIFIISLDQEFNKESQDTLSKLVAEHQGISIRLLISMKHTGTNDLSEEIRMTRVLWALDSGFEHIEVDDSNLLEGWRNREKEGLPRIIESLQSNMWSTMKRIDKDCVSSPFTSDSNSKCVGSGSGSGPGSGSNSEGESTHPLANFEKIIIEDAVSSTTAGINEANNMESQVSESSDRVSALFEGDITNESDEQLFDQFADVMSQAKEYRDQAVAGGLSDAERRNRAEAVALAMANMMGFEEDDSD